VARRVSHDELPLLGRKESVGDVNRDALLTFGRQAVEQQGKVEIGALGANLCRIDFELGEVVFKHHV
jgi:hypothetical protein